MHATDMKPSLGNVIKTTSNRFYCFQGFERNLLAVAMFSYCAILKFSYLFSPQTLTHTYIIRFGISRPLILWGISGTETSLMAFLYKAAVF